MRTWLNAATTAAILLAAAAAVHQLAGVPRLAWYSPVDQLQASLSAQAEPASRSRTALARCREHAGMIHDVHWASACMVLADEARTGNRVLDPADDSPECMLPPERAAVLNAALNAAEGRCMSEAAALEGRLASFFGRGSTLSP